MNKKGFTLVEVLSIIAVLGIMVVLIFPNIGGSNETKKENERDRIIEVIESAAKVYFSFNSNEYKVNIETLINEEYLTNDITDPTTEEKIDGCVRVFKDNEGIYTYNYTTCDNVEVKLEVELNDGESTQVFEDTYLDSSKIELIEPTKENSEFKGWKVVKGNSIIDNNTLIIGTEDTIVYALWEGYTSLIVDLDEGGNNQTLNGAYKSGTTIELETPTREGYTFVSWEVIEGNSIVSGNTLTIGSVDTKIKAVWELAIVKFSYELNGGSTTQEFLDEYVIGTTIELVNPTKEGYTFTGWSVSGTGALLSGNNLTIGSSNITLTANWVVTETIFAYNKSYHVFTVSVTGTYKIELWGAEGGSAKYSTSYLGGTGAYTKGEIYLEKGIELYVYVGGKGESHSGKSSDTLSANGEGYNGGAVGVFYSGNSNGGGGGGATDVRFFNSSPSISDLTWNSNLGLKSRIMVAGGGGGADSHISAPSASGAGGNAGGLIGYDAAYASTTCYNYGGGGTQISGGLTIPCSSSYTESQTGSFGIGGKDNHSGGGGGYYGGGSGYHSSAGGGSSFISGHTGSVAIDSSGEHVGTSLHYSNKYFLSTKMIDGSGYNWTNVKGSLEQMPNPSGGVYSSGVGHTGNGYAKITFINAKIKTTEQINQEILNIQSNISYVSKKSEYIFTVPTTGTYKLEVWGAQGGYGKKASMRGGYGGYSTGNVHLTKGQVLYINVGSQGETPTSIAAALWDGGYNGGGVGYCTGTYGKYGSGGGGATHIATVSGVLSSLSGYSSACQNTSSSCPILIVAGGGGAGFSHSNGYDSIIGGDAGGYTGVGNKPGTQSSGGGSFGQGYQNTDNGSGGGGGFYGGDYGGDSHMSGGGSGYIGHPSLTNKTMYCYNCPTSTAASTKTVSTTNVSETPISNYAKIGDGYARITYIGS